MEQSTSVVTTYRLSCTAPQTGEITSVQAAVMQMQRNKILFLVKLLADN